MQRWRSGRTRTTRNRVCSQKSTKGSNPFLCASKSPSPDMADGLFSCAASAHCKTPSAFGNGLMLLRERDYRNDVTRSAQCAAIAAPSRQCRSLQIPFSAPRRRHKTKFARSRIFPTSLLLRLCLLFPKISGFALRFSGALKSPSPDMADGLFV